MGSLVKECEFLIVFKQIDIIFPVCNAISNILVSIFMTMLSIMCIILHLTCFKSTLFLFLHFLQIVSFNQTFAYKLCVLSCFEKPV